MMAAYTVSVCVFLCTVACVAAAPSLRLPFGIIEGSDLQSQTARRPVFAYYGIPFAEPPVGPLRFKAPVPYAGRGPNNVVSGPGFKASCMQTKTPYGPFGLISEDCLHLNVFAPGTVSSVPRKVIVWIHGGGYIYGDVTAYMPTDLVADHDVIVVSLHYRLGYFGFLATGQRYGAGANSNNGLRDQLMALQWVKDNIASFGGSSSDVTVMGESAGSASVNHLVLSPLSRGLFTKAVMQSGTVFSPWATQPKDKSEYFLRELAERLGCLSWYHNVIPGGFTKYHNNIIDCLRLVPASRFTEPKLPVTFNLADELWAAPQVDGEVIPGEASVLLANASYLRSNGVLDRSYIVGATNLEGFAFSPKNVTEDILRGTIKAYVKFTYPFTSNLEQENNIDFVYSYPRDTTGQPSIQALWDLQTDFLFVWPTVDFVSRLALVSPSTDVFTYLFDHYPDVANTAEKAPGTPHATDLVYLFDRTNQTSSFSYGIELDLDTPDSRAMKDVYRGTLAEFAKTGNPSRSRSGGSPSVWPRFDLRDKQYMALSPRPQTGSVGDSQRISLWQDFLPKIANNIFTGRRRE